MTLKVGSLVFATEQGLGILAKSFVDAGVVTEVAVVAHGRRPERTDWYPGALRIGSLSAQRGEMEEFCRRQDVMLFFETPFTWELIPYCRAHGVKTVLVPMYECMPSELPYWPDLLACPSVLDIECYADDSIKYVAGIRPFALWAAVNRTCSVAFTPVPVAGVPWRQRTRAEVFVHNAGHGGLRGRNGTAELLEAIRYVTAPASFIIRSQDKNSLPPLVTRSDNVHVRYETGTLPYERLYAEGDVFVFPEKFNGLSLPLQEARAAGMLVMATDRFPMNTWLPTLVPLSIIDQPMTEPGDLADIDLGDRNPRANSLIPVASYRKARVAGRCREFDEAAVEPRAIAAKIDEWYGKDLTAYSLAGKAWAEEMSWERLKPRYLELLAK